MRKRIIVTGVVVALLISTVYIVWQVYDLSADYNVATAKLDIKNGNAKIIHIGVPKITSKDKEIELLAASYGFKNVYIEKFTPQQTEKGINGYNKLVENYLRLRNGFNWKNKYQTEVDSLYKIAEIIEN
jgi:hypothetical protein